MISKAVLLNSLNYHLGQNGKDGKTKMQYSCNDIFLITRTSEFDKIARIEKISSVLDATNDQLVVELTQKDLKSLVGFLKLVKLNEVNIIPDYNNNLLMFSCSTNNIFSIPFSENLETELIAMLNADNTVHILDIPSTSWSLAVMLYGSISIPSEYESLDGVLIDKDGTLYISNAQCAVAIHTNKQIKERCFIPGFILKAYNICPGQDVKLYVTLPNRMPLYELGNITLLVTNSAMKDNFYYGQTYYKLKAIQKILETETAQCVELTQHNLKTITELISQNNNIFLSKSGNKIIASNNKTIILEMENETSMKNEFEYTGFPLNDNCESVLRLLAKMDIRGDIFLGEDLKYIRLINITAETQYGKAVCVCSKT